MASTIEKQRRDKQDQDSDPSPVQQPGRAALGASPRGAPTATRSRRAIPWLVHSPGAGSAAGAGGHAATLNRATASQPARAAGALLHLQRQYGNRHVQRVLEIARQGDGDVSPDVEQSIKQARGGGRALDSKVREQMEPSFGSDFSGVRVHTGEQADSPTAR